MVKSVLKEICIILLLCIAIILILGVIFYDYIPSNKVVPNKLSEYTIPENIQSEIEEEVSGINQVEVSYEITSSDLSLYKQTHSYTPGKPDPFSASTSTNETNTNSGTQQGTIGSTDGNTTTTGPNSTGTFFNNTGHK